MKRLTLLASCALFAFSGCSSEVMEPPAPTTTKRQMLDVWPAGYAPEGFNLEGTWVMRPGNIVTSIDDATPACWNERKKDNYLSLGRDTFTLELDDVTFDQRTMIATYSGTYSRWDGFGEDTDTYSAAYGCVTQNVIYDMSAEFHLDIFTQAATFGAEATAVTTGEYSYPQTLGFSAFNVGNGVRNMWVSGDPSEILAGMGFTEYAGRDEVPAECDFALNDVYYSSYDLSRGCIPLSIGGFSFTQTNAAPDVFPKGTVSGVVEETLPDETPTDRKIKEAHVALYRQARHVRDKRPTETDEQYNDYLESVRAQRTLVAETDIVAGDGGAFTFDEIVALTRDPARRGTFRAAEYTIEVTQARSEPLVADPQFDEVFFENGIAYNVRVPGDEVIRLKPFDALGQKIQIAEALEKRAPNGWGADEAFILQDLNALANGTVPKTPAANEAVRRAVWAEIGARDALAHADTLLTFLLDALASLVTDFLVPDINLNPRKIAKAQKRIRDYSPDAAAAQSSLDVLRSGRIEDFHQRLAAKTKVGAKLSNSKAQRASRLKAIAKAAIFNPAKLLASKYASNPSLVSSIIDYVALGFDSIVDVVMTGDVGGFVKSLVKKAVANVIKATKGPLLDNSNAVLPSFTVMASEGIESTRNNLPTWATADRAAYNADRDAALRELTAMNEEASNLIARLEVIKGLSDGASASGDAFAALSGIPAFKAAEKASKVVKTIATVDLFVEPLVYTFFQLPTQTNNIGHLAWGEPLTVTNPVVYTGPLVDKNRLVIEDYLNAANTYRSTLQDLRDAIARDEHETMMDIGFGTDTEPGIDDLFDTAQRMRDRALDEVSSWDGDSAASTERLAVLADNVRTQASHEDMMAEVTAFAVDVITGRFPNLSGWYDLRRDAVVSEIDSYESQLAINRNLLNASANNESTFAQLVRVENLKVSSSSGEWLTPNTAQTLTVTADVVNLSVADIDNLDITLSAATASGSASVSSPVVSVATLGPYDGTSVNSASVSWTVDVSGVDASDLVVVRANFTESDLPPTRYNGSGAAATIGADPDTFDTDLDGLPDAWETAHGLDTTTDDWDADLDGDGVPNRSEFALGLLPNDPDTDGDGRSDGDEVFGGAAGISSDPLETDSDGDGVLDGADGDPLDESTDQAPANAAEPCVALESDTIYLNRAQPAVILPVSNGCAGDLLWTARSEDPDLVKLYLTSNVMPEGNLVLAAGVDLLASNVLTEPDLPSVRVHVYDVGGRALDGVSLNVVFGYEPDGPTTMEPQPDMGGNPTEPDAGPDGPDMGSPDGPSPTNPGDSDDNDSGGCGCSAASTPSNAFWPLALFGLYGIRRRRR